MYQALGTENIEALFAPDPPPPVPMDPASENSAALMGAPLMAFPDQAHQIHIEVHLSFLESGAGMTNPAAVPMMVSHIFQHISLEAQNQANEQMQNHATTDATTDTSYAARRNDDTTPTNPAKEALKAQLELELMQEIMPRLEKVLSTDDGVVALKQQELAIRAKENEDDRMIAEERIKLDKAKLKQKDQSEEEKLKSQEDIAAISSSR